MKKIDMSIYKKSNKFFYLFDVLIKNEVYNKDEFLKTKGITPNSYRRAKNNEQKVGTEIIIKLSKHFKYNIASDDLIDSIEDLANLIYNDMYYKVFKNYEYYVLEIEKLIKENYNVFPILNLLKLFLQINSLKKGIKVIADNITLYEELKKYKNFFNDDLLNIYELLYLTFEKDVTEYALSEEFSDGYSYFIVSYRSWQNRRYVDCLYFADKARSILLRENNIKRIVHLNFNVMSSLNYVKNYKACLEMAQKQMLALESFDCEGFEKETTLKHMLVAALGLGKYELILDLLTNNKNYSLTELTCYLYSMSKISLNDYKKYYEINVLREEYDPDEKEFLGTLNNFIINKDKKALLKLENYKVTKIILEIIKNA